VLARAVGLEASIRARRDRLNRANPAMLHGRVFGRAGLSADTVTAAFADGARVRATLIERLATAIGGDDLRDAVRALIEARRCPATSRTRPSARRCCAPTTTPRSAPCCCAPRGFTPVRADAPRRVRRPWRTGRRGR
jgi:hypothetical protein